MVEPNAELIIAYVRQETRYQISSQLEAIDVRDYIYTEVPGIETGSPIRGRFEIVTADEALAEKIVKIVKRRGTGYNPPDVTIIRTAVNVTTNE